MLYVKCATHRVSLRCDVEGTPIHGIDFHVEDHIRHITTFKKYK